jgi:hypothetical protein
MNGFFSGFSKSKKYRRKEKFSSNYQKTILNFERKYSSKRFNV